MHVFVIVLKKEVLHFQLARNNRILLADSHSKAKTDTPCFHLYNFVTRVEFHFKVDVGYR